MRHQRSPAVFLGEETHPRQGWRGANVVRIPHRNSIGERFAWRNATWTCSGDCEYATSPQINYRDSHTSKIDGGVT